MAFRYFGNPPIYSTTATVFANPTTATLVAELPGLTSDLYEVRFTVGASTVAQWRLEHALSTGLASTGFRQQVQAFTATNQSAEYIYTFKAEVGDIFRALLVSSFTGNAAASIQAEKMS